MRGIAVRQDAIDSNITTHRANLYKAIISADVTQAAARHAALIRGQIRS